MSIYPHDRYIYYFMCINSTFLGRVTPISAIARGGHGRAFALPSLNFALPSKPSFKMI